MLHKFNILSINFVNNINNKKKISTQEMQVEIESENKIPNTIFKNCPFQLKLAMLLVSIFCKLVRIIVNGSCSIACMSIRDLGLEMLSLSS